MMIYKIFSDWCKIKLFYGVAIALSTVFINGNLYAGALTAQEERLVANARDLLQGTDNLDDVITAFELVTRGDFGLETTPSPALKTALSSLRDAQGNTLAHYFVKEQRARGLYSLLKITGLDILDETNANGKKPFSDISLQDLSSFCYQIKSNTPHTFNWDISTQLGAYLAPFLREKMAPLIERWGDHEGIATIRFLDDAIRFSPMALAGQKLENFSQYFENFLAVPEGRNLLRTYRLADGSTLLSYYKKKLEVPWGYQLEEPASLVNSPHFASILQSYILDHVMITSHDLDIVTTEDLIFCLKNMPGSEGLENSSKEFWLQYRNSKGRNLLQLIFEATDNIDDRIDFKISLEDQISKLREKIADNAALLALLTQTDIGDETAAKRIVKTTWGLGLVQFWGKEFWEAMDVSSMVMPGKYGVTPLMQMATAQYVEPLLDHLREKGIPYDQVDAFGNSAESIKEFFNSGAGRTYENLLAENLKSRPLQESLWNDYLEYPYPVMVGWYGYSHPYSTIVFPNPTQNRSIEGLLHVVRQQHQTSLHKAFLQIEVNGDQVEANRLWRSLFKAYDDYNDRALADRRAELSQRRLKSQQYKSAVRRDWVQNNRLDRDEQELEETSQRILRKRAMPMAERALAILSMRENSEVVETILATGGTFGIDFSRKVSPLGGRVVMQRCKELGQRLASKIQFGDNEIKKQEIELQSFQMVKDSLFRDSGLPLDTEKEKKLLNHRLNCAVVTLFSFMHPDDRSFYYPKTDKQFSKIDDVLQSVLPAGHTVNSRKRFEKLYDLYGQRVWEDHLPYRAE